MAFLVCKSVAGARRTTALLAAAAGAMLWGAAMAAQAGEQPSSQPAADAHSGAPAASQPAKPADPKDRVTCRDEEVTGTHLGAKRVCHTKREWDEIENDDMDTGAPDPHQGALKGPH